MTREEAIEFLRYQVDLYEWQAENINALINPALYNEYQNIINSLKMAIKALKQEDIFSKIRAEFIIRDKNVKAVRSDSCCFFTTDEVLEIIDKIESEE